MHYTRALFALLATLTLLLAACADDGGGSTDNSGETTGGSTFNDADVEFAQQMIVHHRGAIEMAQMAQQRSEDPEVKALASDIEQAQGPEIETMTGWLRSWDAEVPEDMSEMEHGSGSMEGSMSQMPGMMSEEQRNQLGQASGDEFDQMFLQMMIEHHQGAIEMAQAEQANGENDKALDLAEQIEADQQAEIETMRKMLES